MQNEQPTQLVRDLLAPVLAIGPAFLAGERDADEMAHTMVAAVESFGTTPHATPSDGHEERLINALLGELTACGGGYLASRCDAACVARTITQLVAEFGQD